MDTRARVIANPKLFEHGTRDRKIFDIAPLGVMRLPRKHAQLHVAVAPWLTASKRTLVFGPVTKHICCFGHAIQDMPRKFLTCQPRIVIALWIHAAAPKQSPQSRCRKAHLLERACVEPVPARVAVS